MFKACWCLGNEDFGGIEALRGALGVAADALDEYAAHVYVSDENGAPIAAGRMYPVEDALRLDKILAAKVYANLPYEELVLRIMLYRARELPQSAVEVEVVPGIEKILPKFGFSHVEGEPRLMRCARGDITWFSQCSD
jgi:hypothetical protein